MAIGIGFRPDLAPYVLRGDGGAGFLELLLEERLASRERAREAEALSEIMPVVIHGTKLSLGSFDGIDDARAARLGELARRTRAFAITEHAAFVRADGIEVGHLSPVPFHRSAAAVIARNLARARRALPDVPLLLENIAWPVRPPGDEMTEADFYASLCEATGAGLLLDLGNLYANARNAGESPLDALRRFPVERARMIHLAGSIERGGFVYDTHAHAVPDEVFGMLGAALERCGPVPIVLERDHGFDWEQIGPELGAIREVARGRGRLGGDAGSAVANNLEHSAFRQVRSAIPSPLAPLHVVEGGEALVDLLPDQIAFARALAGIEEDARLDPEGVSRARDILAHKRVEEALALLPRLRDHAPIARIAQAHVRETRRPARRAAVADARAIADRVASVSALLPDSHPDGRELALADAAALDGLALDARFAFHRDGASPRRGPFVGRATTSRGPCFAVKSIGASAKVHFFSACQVGTQAGLGPRAKRGAELG